MTARHPHAPAPFALPQHLAAKADPTLIDADARQFSDIARAVEHRISDLQDRLEEARREDAREGRSALDRDEEVRRLSVRLRTLGRFGADLCLGRMVTVTGEASYVGRLGLTDADGRRLLLDWRAPAAEPFFGATHADPMGLAWRRRYRWDRGRVVDFWDEVFTPDDLDHAAALDDQSAFVASLGAARTPRMRDVLATIASDQDAIVRADSRGALVVDGGPGTGKTVVALHRTAYLLYADPRLGHRRGGVLFLGPHQSYLDYVSDVLPSLGEEGVATTTLRDLVPQGRAAVDEPDPQVATLKARLEMVAAIEPAIAFHEEPPTERLDVETPWGDVRLGPRDWADAFAAAAPGTPHNESRDDVLEALVEIVVDRLLGDRPHGEPPDGVTEETMASLVRRDLGIEEVLGGSWPLLEATELIGDLWAVPAYLQRCAPWLTPEQTRLLRRPRTSGWTTADLPLLDAARRGLGDRDASRRAAQRRRAEAAAAEEMAEVVDHLIATDDSELQVMSMLRGADLREKLTDSRDVPAVPPDRLAGPFAHVVVDEAQELTDAEWSMVLDRCPSRSLTIVGDRAQARHPFEESWEARLARVGLQQVERAALSINYRTPAEVMAAAEPVIRAVLPDANVPVSVRSTGVPVGRGRLEELESRLLTWLAAQPTGIAAVIGPDPVLPAALATIEGVDRVRALTPVLAKGLEFDLVVLLDPRSWGQGVVGAVDRYVSMTRATQRLVVLEG